MGAKKKKKKNAGPPLPAVRLSQCMIVKNEEKNIEKALSWAKRIAFEQIVVDTGSTDRTVEIAKRMGAKVYHFEWIDDFSAAKNYAIEQATGNWIAFLDADEYLSLTDAKKLMVFIRRIQSDPELRIRYLAINCVIANVDDEGKPFGMSDQERVFRNLPTIRFAGRIHEKLSMSAENIVRVDEIAIIHTGYTSGTIDDTGKIERNIELLRQSYIDNPDDYNTKAYLADALLGRKDEDSIAEADALYLDVVERGTAVYPPLLKKAYNRLIGKCAESADTYAQGEEFGRSALRVLPGDIDIEYNLAVILNKKQEFAEAYELLKGSEKALLSSQFLDESMTVSAKPSLLLSQLAIAAQGLGDIEGVVKYCAMTLSADKSQNGVLAPYIATLLWNGASEDETLGLLALIYDMDDPQDLLFIARAAKDCAALDFARRVLGMIKT